MYKRWNVMRSEGFIWLLLAIVVATLFIPLHSSTMIPRLSDFYDHLRGIKAAKEALLAGQFPLRTMQFPSFPWHYPYFQFYGTFPYTLAGMLGLLLPTAPFYLLFKLTIGLTQWVGAIYLYHLINRRVNDKTTAFFGCLIYLYAPYNISDIAYLGALNEAVSIGLIPPLLYYLTALFEGPIRLSDLLKASLIWSFIICTHIITSIYFSFCCAVYFLVLWIATRKSYRHILSVVSVYVLGILLSLWYVWPIIVMQPYLIAREQFLFWFWAMFGEVNTHILLSIWPHYSEIVGYTNHQPIYDYARPGMGWPLVLGVIIYAVLCFRHKIKWSAEGKALVSVLLFAIGLMLAPRFFWEHLPKDFLVLEVTRRLLIDVMWAGVLVSVMGLHVCLQSQYRTVVKSVLAVLIAFTAITWFTQVDFGHVPLHDLTNDHGMMSRPSYLLDYRAPFPLDGVDNVTYDVAMSYRGTDQASAPQRGWLRLNEAFHIPVSLIQQAYKPTLFVENRADQDMLSRPPLNVMVDGESVAQYPWYWPGNVLSVPLNYSYGDTDVVVQFNAMQFFLSGSQSGPAMAIPVQHLYIGGFIPEDVLVDFQSVEPYCSIQGAHTLCDLSAQPGIAFLELPMLYYPGMLRLRVNGQDTPYQSILYGDKILAGFKPFQNQPNQVDIWFAGLDSVNTISLITWLLWLSASLVLIGRAYARSSK